MLSTLTNNPDIKDCLQFYTDLNNCIKYDLQYHKAELSSQTYNYFDFTKCKEFESFKDKNYNGQISIQINLSDLIYPHNRYYSFRKKNKIIEIKLSD